jgi:isopentenyl diphosphate isomerase/L-lactate dehydrogenase-like FMN-dependent dehydrogenase
LKNIKINVTISSMSPKTISSYQTLALAKLGPSLTDYIQKTAGEGKTFKANLDVFSTYQVVPAAPATDPQTSLPVLNKPISAPIMIAPTAWHKMFTSNGEADTSAAARAFGTNYVISSFSTLDFNEIDSDLSHTWYQLLMYKDVELMKRYIKKAEDAGCSGIVLTIDAVTGCSMCKSDPSVAPITFPVHKLPVFPENPDLPYTTLDDYYEKYMPMVLDWNVIKEIVSYTKLPVILKGILNNEDAHKAIEVGAKAIVVSNHGGRQNDEAVATLIGLTTLTPDVKEKIDVYLDGGVRSGADIFKALALGAKAVLVGRPALYGLALNGKDGLVDVLNIFANELKEAMVMAGCQTLADINVSKISKGSM